MERFIKCPDMHMGHPDWWHHHGTKMRVEELRPKLLVISGSAASVKIYPKAETEDEGWYVKWKVVFSVDCQVNGRTWMSTENLECAFGLSNREGGEYWDAYRNWMIDRFGGECAYQGAFIRWRDYLNIPGPGMGHDGDPNVSIDLDAEINQAVQKLISGIV